MPSPDVRSIHPHPDSRWRCPCGYESTWGNYRWHRRANKGSEVCKGKGIKIYDPVTDEDLFGSKLTISQDQKEPVRIEATLFSSERPLISEPLISEPPPAPESEVEGGSLPQGAAEAPDLSAGEGAPDPTAYEYRGEDNLFGLPTDTEALARLYNQRRAEPVTGGGNGHGDDLPPGILGTVPPDADFAVETSSLPPQVSQYRETVQVAPIARVIYDWARQQGWRVGDGSFSAFVMDLILDHFWNCWNMGVYIVGREEIKIGRRTQ